MWRNCVDYQRFITKVRQILIAFSRCLPQHSQQVALRLDPGPGAGPARVWIKYSCGVVLLPDDGRKTALFHPPGSSPWGIRL